MSSRQTSGRSRTAAWTAPAASATEAQHAVPWAYVPAPAEYLPAWCVVIGDSSRGEPPFRAPRRDLHPAAVAGRGRDDQSAGQPMGTLPHRGKADPPPGSARWRAVPLVADRQPHAGAVTSSRRLPGSRRRAGRRRRLPRRPPHVCVPTRAGSRTSQRDRGPAPPDSGSATSVVASARATSNGWVPGTAAVPDNPAGLHWRALHGPAQPVQGVLVWPRVQRLEVTGQIREFLRHPAVQLAGDPLRPPAPRPWAARASTTRYPARNEGAGQRRKHTAKDHRRTGTRFTASSRRRAARRSQHAARVSQPRNCIAVPAGNVAGTRRRPRRKAASSAASCRPNCASRRGMPARAGRVGRQRTRLRGRQ